MIKNSASRVTLVGSFFVSSICVLYTMSYQPDLFASAFVAYVGAYSAGYVGGKFANKKKNDE